MPVDQPQVGETWELYDPTTEKASQAVVVELRFGTPLAAEAVRLVNRLGRSMVIPTRSFLQMWRFAHDATEHTCVTCSNQACFQTNDDQGWVWICERHLRLGAQALLPADRPQDRDLLLVGDLHCPHCNTTSSYPGSGAECDPETLVVVHRCGRCGSQWALILGAGQDDDGLVLSESVTSAAEALHGRVLNIRAIVGHAAWAAIRRVIRPATHIAGVPVQQGPNIGALTVIVIGSRVSTGGVQRLGGVQITRTPVEPVPILPGIATIWRNHLGGPLVVVRELQETAGGHDVLFSDGEATHRLDARDFVRNYGISHTPIEATAPAPRPPPEGSPAPRPGETWWFRGPATRPVFVLAVNVNEAGSQAISYKDMAEATATASVAEFLTKFSFDPPDPGCAPGEEWVDHQGTVFRIDEVRLGRREIVVSSTTSTRGVVPLALFVTRFRKLVRKSVYSHLDKDDF